MERPPPDSPTSPPPQRAGDADRERAAQLLRTAASEGKLSYEELDGRLSSALSAVTRAELEALLADVQDGGELAPVAPPSSPRLKTDDGTRWTVAVMSGAKRSGRWRPAERGTVLSVMGGVDIDLRDAEFAQPVTTIRVIAVMSGAKVLVPDGVDVEVSKLAIMGDNDVRLGSGQPAPGAPVVRLRLVSIMSGISVRRPKRKNRELEAS
jgi:hypothetical protein